MTICENIQKAKEEISKACAASGRREDEVRLIAVTKTRTPEEINEAILCGVSDIGENRVQELNGKLPYLNGNPHIHLIGALQTNKVKQIIGKAEFIHSLDRVSLAEEIEKQAKKLEIEPVKALIEINIAEETTKSGIFANNLPDFLDILTNFRYINPIGLMTVAPVWADDAQQHIYFEKMQSLLLEGQRVFGSKFSQLSMGMSRDYVNAVKHGATMVRLGTSIFGERKYNI